jgi:plastocyanin
MKPKLVVLPALLALAVGLFACGGGDDSTVTETQTAPAESGGESEPSGETESEPAPSGAAAKAEKVKIVEFTYQADPVVVRVGGKVIWQNEDTAPHTATADDGSFDTGMLERGKIKSETFKEAGTFPYFCEVHPTMHGTVEVVE